MTGEELKDKVRQLIGRNKTKQAIDLYLKWAHQENREQLKSDLALLKNDLAKFNREKLLGTLYQSEANTRQSQLTKRVLDLLGTIDEVNSVDDIDTVASKWAAKNINANFQSKRASYIKFE